MTDNQPINFSPLDPTRDVAPFDREIAALISEAAAARERNTERVAVGDEFIAQVAGWLRPALTFTVPIAAIAALALFTVRPHAAPQVASADWTVADAVGIPSKIAEWSDGTASPPPLELLSEINRAGAPRTAQGR